MQSIELKLSPKEASSDANIRLRIAKILGIDENEIRDTYIRKRSIDARQKNIIINLSVDVYLGEERLVEDDFSDILYQDVSNAKEVIVVGAGPCGLFASLKLIELGLKPILLERGVDVISRRKDLALLEKSAKLNPESNYGYGEGGAGAFSDGKLYTRSKKRGSVDKILRTLCLHGADRKILIDAHPHIGTDKLPIIIKNIRETILKYGGEVHFSTRVTSLIKDKNNKYKVIGVRDQNNKEYIAPVILATGHSARDIYQSLYSSGISLESKPIAVGFRIEHPQELIDQIRYHNPKGRGEYLPAAEYVYKIQINGRGVYSFCMCPGGFIVPASTGENQQVVNGMSPANRGSKWANSGMVVEIRQDDIRKDYPNIGDPKSPMYLLNWTEELERRSYFAAGKSLNAPTQRLMDFVDSKFSNNLTSSSYSLGLVSSNLREWMPKHITERLALAFRNFDKSSKGFLTNEAQLLAVESRTSSPLRIPRDATTLEHIEMSGLFPSGEGAGYAGGIVSAAIDGENSAIAVSKYISK